MKGTTFSEGFSKKSIVHYNDMEMGPSYDMKLSSSYEKTFQSSKIMNANPLCSIGDALNDLCIRWIICRISIITESIGYFRFPIQSIGSSLKL